MLFPSHREHFDYECEAPGLPGNILTVQKTVIDNLEFTVGDMKVYESMDNNDKGKMRLKLVSKRHKTMHDEAFSL